MIPIIEDYIRRSRNGDLYDDALDCIRVLRQACVREDEAVYFNQFLGKIKALCF
jgi:hypothetical protein